MHICIVLSFLGFNPVVLGHICFCGSSQEWEEGFGTCEKGATGSSTKFFCSRHTIDPPVFLVSDNKGARESLKFEDIWRP